MAEGRYTRDEKSPFFVPSTRVQQCARSGVNVPPRAAAPLWRVGYAEGCCQVKRLWTAEAPDGAMLLLFACEVCCAVVVLRWTVVLVYARGTYAISK